MIEKVEIITNMQPQTELEKSILRVFNGVATKLNEVIDAVNGVLAAQEQYATIYNEDIVPMLTPQNKEPDYITTSYKTDGKQKKYYGQNGAYVETDFPIPAGFTITIKE